MPVVRLTFQRILEVVAAQAGTTVGALKVRNRDLAAVRARAILISRRIRPELSVTLLAQLLGRHTSSIVQAHQRAEAAYAQDPDEHARVWAALGELGVAELPEFEWSARSLDGLPAVERAIAATQARLVRLQIRRQQILERAA
jgi:hypothetical protein